MYKGRLFTFGCSFTKYHWPTWADILGKEFEEHYNLGKLGGGNLFIACSVAEAAAKYNISSNDTVMVMWTNAIREDRYINNFWMTPGNIFTNPVYPEEFIKKFITIRGCYVRDLAQIYLTDNLLQNIGCKYEFMSMVDITNSDQYSNRDDSAEIQDILDLYKSSIDKFKPSVHKVLFNYDWDSKPSNIIGDIPRRDKHPLPLEHLEYIRLVLPEYNVSDDIIKRIEACQNEVSRLATRPRGVRKIDPEQSSLIFKYFNEA